MMPTSVSKTLQKFVKIELVSVVVLACVTTLPSFGQTLQLQPRLLSAVGIFSQASGIRNALPGFLDQSGHERRILSGTVTEGSTVTPFTFTREMDQKVRLDSGSPSTRSLVVAGLHTLASPTSKSSGNASQTADYDALETLAEDAPEGLLYSFGTAARVRWLGDGFRTDDGPNPNYSGPFYSIYAAASHSGVQPGNPARDKVFLFELATQLLSETHYTIQKNGAAVSVVVKFAGWTLMNGRMAPASIVRTENGSTTLSISITAASSAATQVDSLFTI